jgi:hypothetical protein
MDSAHVLMQSDLYPKLAPAVARTWTYGQKRILYLDLGQGSLGLPLDRGPTAHNESFKNLLNRGIPWAAGRL